MRKNRGGGKRGERMNSDFNGLLSFPHTDAEGKWLRERLETLSVRESAVLTALLSWKEPKMAADAVNLLLNVNQCAAYSPVSNYADLGKRYLQEEGVTLPDDAAEFTNMEELGRICERKFPGEFVGDCYVLRPGRRLPEPYSERKPEALDEGWNIRVKLASESCPEGAWIHFPDYSFAEEEMSGEIGIALRRLGVEDGGDCQILDARCDVPGVGDIPAQYDSIEALLYDANNMGFLLEERFRGAPDLREKFAATLEYENGSTLAEAVSIGDDLSSYDIVKVENLRGFAKQELYDRGVPPEMHNAVDLEAYGERSLLDRGYRKSGDGTLFVGRPDCAAEHDAQRRTPKKKKKAEPTR